MRAENANVRVENEERKRDGFEREGYKRGAVVVQDGRGNLRQDGRRLTGPRFAVPNRFAVLNISV